MEGILDPTASIYVVSNSFKSIEISPLSEINRCHIQTARQLLPILSKRLMDAPAASARQLARHIETESAANVRGGELM